MAGLVAAGCGVTPHAAPPAGRRAPGATSTTQIPSALEASRPVKLANTALVSVSCPAPGTCSALDTSGVAYRMSAGRWSSPEAWANPPGPESSGTPAVSCPTTTFCMAVALDSQVGTWNGTWSAPSTLGGAAALQALSCSSPTFCVALDGIGDGYVFTGSWSGPVNAYGGANGVSCVSPTFCMAALGGPSEWDGTSWSQPAAIDTSGEIETVSCTSSTFCMAGDTNGNTFVWNGAAWSGPTRIDTEEEATGGNKLAGVSCVNTACLAVDASGHALRYDGATWTAPVEVARGASFATVSCATATWCEATTTSGQALTVALGAT